jgi:uncharacterized protein (TIGR03435 family)
MYRLPLTMALLSRAIHSQEPAFEVASVKPASPDAQGAISAKTTTDSILLGNFNLQQLIRYAYKLQDYQLSGGPKWAGSDGFDINAKADASIAQLTGEAKADRMRAMMRTLLAERFQLTMRREMKDVPAYALTIAKGGFKLKKLEPGNPPAISGRPNMSIARNATIAEFINLLSARLARPILDKTGIEGIYDFVVQHAPLNGPPDSTDPSLFTALQETCGLKLEPTTAPAEAYVIERAEKPTGN